MRKETRWMIAGIICGLLLASVIAGVVFLLHRRTTAEPMASAPPTAESTAPAAVQGSNTDSATPLSPEEQAKIGLQTAEVVRETASRDITTIGRVEEPETAIGTVSTRFGGRIDHLFVNYVGQPVKRGDPVATITITGQPVQKDDPFSSIYSRDLIAAVEDYRFALENKERVHRSSRPDALAQADALVEASRVRLDRWGLTEKQIEGVLASPEQPIQINVYSEIAGIVRMRKVTEGQFVNAGDSLLDLTDLKTVWVKADVFDSDIAQIRPGLKATVTSEAIPGLKLVGAVDFIDPHSDSQAHTTPVRIQVGNPGTRLNPGMVVQVSFHMSLGSLLTIPREAVIDTGTEKVVYIVRDNGIFQRHTIQTGPPLNDRYPVTEGLALGDKVVTNGVFLVDSQTRLTGGMTGLFGGSKSFGANVEPAAGSNSAFKMAFRIDPDPPMGGKENTIHVSLVDATGKPVNDAEVRVTFVMPAMPSMSMPEMRNSAELKWGGSEYTGSIQIMMTGSWNVAIEARRGNELLATAQAHANAH